MTAPDWRSQKCPLCGEPFIFCPHPARDAAAHVATTWEKKSQGDFMWAVARMAEGHRVSYPDARWHLFFKTAVTDTRHKWIACSVDDGEFKPALSDLLRNTWYVVE